MSSRGPPTPWKGFSRAELPSGAIRSVFGRKMRSRLVRTNQEETQQSVRISRIVEQKQQKRTILVQQELAPVLTEIPHAPQIVGSDYHHIGTYLRACVFEREVQECVRVYQQGESCFSGWYRWSR